MKTTHTLSSIESAAYALEYSGKVQIGRASCRERV